MNEDMSSIHLELLDDERLSVFQKLSFLKTDGVLAGGTALSLQIAHRLSFDFDIFLNREIKRDDLIKLKENFEIQNIVYNTPDQLTVIASSEINISLINYPFKPLFEKINTGSISLLSLNDIAADKAYTIGRRAVWRDYVDMYFILRDHLSIQKTIKLAGAKFGLEFSPKLFLEQLVYFDDIDIVKIVFATKEILPDKIKNYLVGEVKTYRNLNFLIKRI